MNCADKSPDDYCAIDFGTSNSAMAIATPDGIELVTLENENDQPRKTMPTAVFFRAEGEDLHRVPALYGRAAIRAYVEGKEGRLMRSMKSVLGTTLLQQKTEIGAGRSVEFSGVIASYLRHLKNAAQDQARRPLERVVLGRPVFFVDDDPVRDARAQAALEEIALSVGFTQVQFQYEPIAAAMDYEAGSTREQLVMVADIGGGTSDFSLVRVGPDRRVRADRQSDILANFGVHVAGTDFDRQIELARILPELGYGSFGPARGTRAPLPVPSSIYFELATWHLINTAYSRKRMHEVRLMRGVYANHRHHDRLMTTLRHRLGHALAALAEEAKIDVADGGVHVVDLGAVERELQVAVSQEQIQEAIVADMERIAAGPLEAIRLAGIAANDVDAIYFTGGSTGFDPLVRRLASHFPTATAAFGDRLASVAKGLGLDARRRFAS
jgi:hypothetical chaperone protein